MNTDFLSDKEYQQQIRIANVREVFGQKAAEEYKETELGRAKVTKETENINIEQEEK